MHGLSMNTARPHYIQVCTNASCQNLCGCGNRSQALPPTRACIPSQESQGFINFSPGVTHNACRYGQACLVLPDPLHTHSRALMSHKKFRCSPAAMYAGLRRHAAQLKARGQRPGGSRRGTRSNVCWHENKRSFVSGGVPQRETRAAQLLSSRCAALVLDCDRYSAAELMTAVGLSCMLGPCHEMNSVGLLLRLTGTLSLPLKVSASRSAAAWLAAATLPSSHRLASVKHEQHPQLEAKWEPARKPPHHMMTAHLTWCMQAPGPGSCSALCLPAV